MNIKKLARYEIQLDVSDKGIEKISPKLERIRSFIEGIKPIDTLIDSKVFTKEEQELNKYKSVVLATGDAIVKAFQPGANVVNLKLLNKELSKAGVNAKDVSKAFKNFGKEGKIAFETIAEMATRTSYAVRQTHGVFDKLGETLFNTIRWKIASSFIDSFTNSLSSAWGYSKALDTSLNNIRIVTGKSADEMERFATQANKAAKNLSASTTAYSDAALIYYQQGLSDKDVFTRADITVKAANVTGQSAAEVSEQLTAVWNGYKVVAEEAELYIDKLAAVAASTAADLEEISDGMSKVASAANTMGVDIDQLTAQLATIVSVTRQDASAVGTALKTIYARMGDLKVDGVDEFGTTLGDVSGQLKQMGIDVLDQQGNLRDMGNVIEEVAEKWSTWTDAQQQAAAVAMAGKRQYNNLIALFENWDMYESSMVTAKNAEGTLEEQQKTYKESLKAIMQEISTAMEGVKGALFDPEVLADIKPMIIWLIEALEKIIKAFNGLKGLVPFVIAAILKLSPKTSANIAKGLSDIFITFKNTKETFMQLRSATKNANAFAKELEGVNDELSKAIHNRAKLAQMKQSGLISEEEFTNISQYNEAIFANNQAIIEGLRERKQMSKELNDFLGDRTDFNYDDIIKDESQIEALNKAIDKKTQKVKMLRMGTSGDENKRKESYSHRTQNLIAQYGTNEQQLLAQTAFSNYSKAVEQGGDAANKAWEIYKQQLTRINKDIIDSINKTADAFKNYGEDVKNGADTASKAQQSLKDNSQMVENEMKKIEAAQTAQTMVNIGQSILSAVAAVQSFSAALEGLRDGSADVFQVVISGLGGVVATVGAATTSIDLIVKANQSGGSKAQKAWGWIGLILTLVSALITGVYEAYKYFESQDTTLTKLAKNFEKIKNSAEEAKKELSSLREEYLNLIDTLSNYRDAKTAIDEMQAGTQEWRLEVQKLNWEILDLIEKYPMLKEGLKVEKDVFGMDIYSLSEASISNILKSREIAIKTQEREVAARNLDLAISQRKGAKGGYDYLKAKSKTNLSLEDVKDPSDFGLSQIKEILNKYNISSSSVIERKTEFEYLEPFINDPTRSGPPPAAVNVLTEEGYEQLLNLDFSKLDDLEKSLNSLNAENEELVNSLSEIAKIIKENKSTIEKNTQAEKDAYEAYLATIAPEKVNASIFADMTKKIDTSHLRNKIEVARGKGDSYGGIVDYENINELVRYEYNEDGTFKLDENGNPIVHGNKLNVGGNINKGDVDQVHDVADWYAKALGVQIEDYGVIQGKTLEEALAAEITLTDGTKLTYRQLFSRAIQNAEDQAVKNELTEYSEYLEGLSDQRAAYFHSKYGKEMFTQEDINTAIGEMSISDLQNVYALNNKDYNTANGVIESFKGKYRTFFENGDIRSGFKNIATNTLKEFAVAIETAKIAGLEKSENLYAAVGNLTDEQAAKFIAAFNATNFTDALEVEIFIAEMSAAGVAIDQLGKDWKTFIETAVNGTNLWLDAVGQLGERFAYIRDTLSKIKIGDILSEEQYKDVIEANPFASKYFVKGAGGYFAIASGETISQSTLDRYSSNNGFKNTLEKYAEIRNTLNAKGNATIDKASVADAEHIKETLWNKLYGSNVSNAAELLLSDLSVLGWSGNELQKVGNALSTLERNPADLSPVEIKLLQNAINTVNDAGIKKTRGDFSDGQVYRNYASSGIDWNTFKTVTEIKDSLTEEQQRGLEDSYKLYATNFANELGIALSEVELENLDVNAVNELEERVLNMRYAELNLVEEIGYELDENARKRERAYSLEASRAAAEEEIDLLSDKFSLLNTQSDYFKAEFLLRGKNSDFWNGGSFDLAGAYKELEKLEGDEKTNLQAIINSYLAWQEKQNEAAEAEAEIWDARIEQFNLEYKKIKEIRDAIDNIGKTANKWAKTFIFGRKDALGSLTEATANTSESSWIRNAAAARKQFQDIQEAKNDRASAYWQNGEFNESQWIEDSTEVYEDWANALEEGEALGETLYDAWTEALAGISEMYQDQIDKLSTINSLLETGASLTQLLSSKTGNYAKTIQGYYGAMSKNAEDSLANSKANMEALSEQYYQYFNEDGTLKIGLSEQEKILANEVWKAYAEASEKYYESMQSYLNVLTAQFENGLKAAIDQSVAAVTDGLGIDAFSELWNLEQDKDNRYFDNVNAEYEKAAFEKQIQMSINETDSLTAQNKLRKVMQEQLAILEKKDKLSQYDLDRANAMYEITLKEIALEEARQNSSKMKLARDAFGNYTYQYVQDQDQIAQAEADLAAAENNLYNLQKDHQKDLIDTLLSGLTEYQELATKYINDPVMWEKIQAHYSGFFTDIKGDLAELGADIDSVFGSDTPWMNIFDAVSGVNLNEILSQANTLYNGEDGKGGILGSLSSLETMFNNSNVLNFTNSLAGFTKVLTSDDANDFHTKLDNAANKLSNVSNALSTAASKIEEAAKKFVQDLSGIAMSTPITEKDVNVDLTVPITVPVTFIGTEPGHAFTGSPSFDEVINNTENSHITITISPPEDNGYFPGPVYGYNQSVYK